MTERESATYRAQIVALRRAAERERRQAARLYEKASAAHEAALNASARSEEADREADRIEAEMHNA